MREIKFRVWDKKNSQFLKYLDDKIIFDLWDWTDFMSTCLIFPVYDYIIQQYTGLTDKNNKEIYEGDILRFDPDIRDLIGGNCIYSNLGHVWIYSLADGITISYNHPYSEMSDSWSDIVDRGIGEDRPLSYEVVGNIMENPELMQHE